jgi:hypothetical protein
VRPAPRQASFTIPVVVTTWVVAWLVANLVAGIVVAVAGHADTAAELRPVWVFAVSALALWAPYLVALAWASDRYGTGLFREDYHLSARPIDLLGLPIGVLSQLVLVNLVYWPLRSLFPDTFSTEEVEERARTLYESATGAWLVLFVLVVVIGAPFVEELVYRGFIQTGLSSRIDDLLALVVTAAWFALIHFQPVEYPGLFAFALVLGSARHLTGRLGMPILAHVGFNATGIALVALQQG